MKVYCRNCKHLACGLGALRFSEVYRCRSGEYIEDWYSRRRLDDRREPSKKNVNNDCPDFEKWSEDENE